MARTGRGGDRSRIGHSYLLPAVTFSMVPLVNCELPETGPCLVFACVLRCPRLVSVVSWLWSSTENDWLSPAEKPWPGWVTQLWTAEDN